MCLGWYWVAKWVCIAWYWVAKWVCKAFVWIVKAVCLVFSWVLQLACVAWDWLRCAVVAIVNAISGLFGGDRSRPSVDKVFVLMLENRSFDHVFGLSGLRWTSPSGEPVEVDGILSGAHTNVDPLTGVAYPAVGGAEFSLKGVDKDPGHEFENTVVALCGDGSIFPPSHVYPPIDNSGFIANYRHNGSTEPWRIMYCFEPERMPVLNQLAREFAVCDAWFSSLPGPTWPNRFFAAAASSGGLDRSPTDLETVAATTVDGYRFENGTIYDALDDACIEWRIVEGDDFPVSFALAGMNLNALQGRFTGFEDFVTEVQSPTYAPRYVFVEPKYGAHGFDVTGPGDFTCGNSMHPLDDVTRGEQLIKDVYDALRRSPHWERSVLVITFDEHGGFYDHVQPPPAVPPGDTPTLSNVQWGFKFDRLGVRVPAVVVSPLVRRGTIDKTVYDHTSILATVERMFGLRSLTKRDAAANDLIHLLTGPSRDDTPRELDPPAHNDHPLPCEGDDEPTLRSQRQRIVQAASADREFMRLVQAKPEPSQIGFTQIALRRVEINVPAKERAQWRDRYLAIRTAGDAALFMIDAKLRLKHGQPLGSTLDSLSTSPGDMDVDTWPS